MSTNNMISPEKERYLQIELTEVLDKSVEIAASLGMDERELIELLHNHFGVEKVEAVFDTRGKFNSDAGP